jgi:alkanesulfonate monooxygenase SsuD/methylene tetrahydromethanopterin reductase-like flavin-dependent oxidoreductase (luciferase family)
VNRVQIGVVYPQIELGGEPTAVRRFGRAVEELGFDHLLAYDHVLGAVHAGRTPRLTGPYTERDPFHDPFVMFAYLAGMTERIGFATGVLILPQRQTTLVARQAADVDLFSGGRLRLGVGVGWSPVEYEALGQDFRSRGARQEGKVTQSRRCCGRSPRSGSGSSPSASSKGGLDRTCRPHRYVAAGHVRTTIPRFHRGQPGREPAPL